MDEGGEEQLFHGEEMTVEEAIEKHVGSLGISQVVQVVLVSLAWMFDSQTTLATIFTDAQPSEWRCKGTEASSSSCRSRSDGGGGVCGLSPGTWEWVGGHGSTTIAEWDLICNRKFLAAVPASLFFFGSLLGSGVYGRLADAYLGRKKTVVISCILTSATAFLTSLSPNLYIYALLRFANGFARSGIGICCLVLSTEVVGRKWRGQISQYGFFFFTTGFLSLPLIAYLSRTSWRNVYRIISVLPLPYSLLILLFVSESPRWLLVRGRDGEAVDVLNKLARQNGKKLPANLRLVNPAADAAADAAAAASDHIATTRKKSLWSTGWAAKRMVMVMVAGFGVGSVYYGVQLNMENLSFSLYLTAAVNAMMEIPAVFIGSLLLSFTNRRILFSGSIALAGVSCIVCIFFSGGSGSGSGSGARKQAGKSKGSWLQLTVESIGFMAASTAFDVLYIYCVELFPTNVRNFAVSMLRQALMLGASIAPMLVVVGRLEPARSFLIFGLLSVVSGVLGMLLPETKNAPLYDTLEQQEEEEKLSLPRLTSNDSALELGGK